MKINISKNVIIIICIGLTFFVGFYFNEYIWSKSRIEPLTTFEGMNLGLLKDVIDTTIENYVDPQKIDRDKMTYGAISGLINSLDDPYTVFLDPEEARKFDQDLAGQFDGIGVQFGSKDGQIKVITPLKDTPAYYAGIKAGDVILEIDGKTASEMSVDEVVNNIRGEKGTIVKLKISRTKTDGGTEIKEIEITRATIVVPISELKFINQNGKTIAHLSLFHFSTSVYSDFVQRAYEILAENPDGIILDLRNNPGGLLNETVDIAGWFLPKGSTVLIEEKKDLQRKEYKSPGPSILSSIPLVVLINKGSASASEILAGALRDQLKAEIIGENSFGKGTVQNVQDFDDGSSLKITIAKWYTPSGERIQDTGIKPDIEIVLTDQDYQNNLDPQLDKAVVEIQKLIK